MVDIMTREAESCDLKARPSFTPCFLCEVQASQICELLALGSEKHSRQLCCGTSLLETSRRCGCEGIISLMRTFSLSRCSLFMCNTTHGCFALNVVICCRTWLQSSFRR